MQSGPRHESPVRGEVAPPASSLYSLENPLSKVSLAQQYEAYEQFENEEEEQAEIRLIRGERATIETLNTESGEPKRHGCESCIACLHKLRRKCNVASTCRKWWRRVRRVLFLVSDFHFAHRGKMRSQDSVQKEQIRQISSSCCIIHPYSLLRYFWELTLAVAVLVFLTTVPVEMWLLQQKVAWSPVATWLFSTLFMLDIVMNFRTGYVDPESEDVKLNERKICTSYLRTWFIVDLLSALPYEAVLVLINGAYQFIDSDRVSLALKQLGLFRLLLIFKLYRYLRNVLLGQDLNGLEIRLGLSGLILVVMAHWITCAHCAVQELCLVFGEPNPGVTWIEMNDLQLVAKEKLYAFALLRTIGLGVISSVPNLLTEVILLLLNATILFFLLFIFMANFYTLIQSLHATEMKFIKISREIDDYMKFYHIPVGLRRRIHAYLSIRYKGYCFSNSMLEYLSPCLQNELLLNSCLGLVEEVPFFASLQRHIVQEIVANLEFDVYMPNDVLIWAGTVGDGMYFILHGNVAILAPDGRPLTILKDGNFFGEMSLVFSEPRAATVVANSQCDIYKLSKENFMRVIAPYPSAYESIVKVAESRAQTFDKTKLYKAATEKLSEQVDDFVKNRTKRKRRRSSAQNN